MLDLDSINNAYNNLKEDKNKFNDFAIEIIPLLINEIKITRNEVVKVVTKSY